LCYHYTMYIKELRRLDSNQRMEAYETSDLTACRLRIKKLKKPQDGYAPSTDPYQGTVLLLELQGRLKRQGGIRTHGGMDTSSVFKTDLIILSSTCP
jgi:hypothetical protein